MSNMYLKNVVLLWKIQNGKGYSLDAKFEIWDIISVLKCYTKPYGHAITLLGFRSS